MFDPTFWVVIQMLGQNNQIAGFVHIVPNAGLYLPSIFLECIQTNIKRHLSHHVEESGTSVFSYKMAKVVLLGLEF